MSLDLASVKYRFRSLPKRFVLADMPNLLAIAAAMVAAIAGMFSFVFSPRDSVIFALLTLIIGHLLLASQSERQRHTETERLLKTLAERVGNSVVVAGSFKQLPPFENRMKGAREVWIHGPTLEDFLASNWQTIDGLFERGVKIRFLVASVEGRLPQLLVDFFGAEKRELDDYLSAIRASERKITKWIAKYPSLAEGRAFEVFPSHNLLIINPKQPDEEAQMHANMHKSPTASAPLLVLRRAEFTAECDALREEFETIWNPARPIQRESAHPPATFPSVDPPPARV